MSGPPRGMYDYGAPAPFGAAAPPPAAAYAPPPAAYQPAHGYGGSYGAPPQLIAQPYMLPSGPGGGGGGGYGHPAGTDELRTIFVSGFPADVKERELNNLLRFLPGYEASQMNWKGGQAQGFALFSNGHFARMACDTTAQLRFDESSVLRSEMARKNMYIKADEPSVKRARTAPAAPPVAAAPGGGPAGDNPPCNTLFVGNLGDNTTEEELRSVFEATPGFQLLKLVRGAARTTAFVEYADTESAVEAHAANQDTVLVSSDRGALRVQFSKNPWGKKRDVTGVLIDTLPKE